MYRALFSLSYFLWFLILNLLFCIYILRYLCGYHARYNCHNNFKKCSTLLISAAAPSLTYKDLETKVNKWTSELEQQEKLFLTQATHVNAWNKILIENAEKVSRVVVTI